MHALCLLADHLAKLERCLTEGKVPGILAYVARICPIVGHVHTIPLPDSPRDRAEWDRWAAPALVVVRRCEVLSRNMVWPLGPRGVTWSPLWLTWFLADLAMYLEIPGQDDLFTANPEPIPMPPLIGREMGRSAN